MSDPGKRCALFLHGETLACVAQGCVVCSFKVLETYGGARGDRLDFTGCRRNERPENCARERERREAKARAALAEKGVKRRVKGWKKEEKRRYQKRRRIALELEAAAEDDSDDDIDEDALQREEDARDDPESTRDRAATVGNIRKGQRVLSVGDGDLSFSLGIAASVVLGRLVATTYEPRAKLEAVYPAFAETIAKLQALGASVEHGVDAATLQLAGDTDDGATVPALFDRIVWNFPCVAVEAGDGATNLDAQSSQMDENKELLRRFFAVAKGRLAPGGEVHVAHKTRPPFSWWNLPEIAAAAGLATQGCMVFDRALFPGYTNRKALVSESFPAQDAVVYVFHDASTAPEAPSLPAAPSAGMPDSLQAALLFLANGGTDGVEVVPVSRELAQDVHSTLQPKAAGASLWRQPEAASPDGGGADGGGSGGQSDGERGSAAAARPQNPFALLQDDDSSSDEDEEGAAE